MYKYGYHICLVLSLSSHVKPACFLLPPVLFAFITFPDSLLISRVRYLSSSHMTVSWYLGLLNPDKWTVYRNSLIYETSLPFSIILIHESHLWQHRFMKIRMPLQNGFLTHCTRRRKHFTSVFGSPYICRHGFGSYMYVHEKINQRWHVGVVKNN